MKQATPGFQGAKAALAMAALDAAIFLGALRAGVAWYNAHLASFVIALLLTFVFASFYRRLRPLPRRRSAFSLLDIVIACCVLFLRGGFLSTLIDVLGVSPQAAGIGGAVFSAAAFCWARLVWSPGNREAVGADPALHRPWRTGSIVLFVVLLRLFFGSSFELLHEEAYYWLYAQFLDIGYLDHPPMVGWLIWFFTNIFGPSEFAIRLGAFASWLIAAGYAARLSFLVGGKVAGRRALLLMAALPVFFGTGMIMTPDAPLVACWAAALYYLYRALIDERPSAWLGVGISMGLGLLSKYTMVLLGGAAWVFFLVTPEGRRWLTRPHPYLAALLALALFSPVIIWNATHEWVSFYFQGIGRHQGLFNFGLQDLVGSALVLLTPTGLFSLTAIAWRRRQMLSGVSGATRQGLRLLAVLTLLPLAVFLAFSLFRMSKLNWTAPIWLGALPHLALFTRPTGRHREGGPEGMLFFPRLWPATTATLLVLYGVLLYYLAIGLPGIPYPQKSLDLGKRSLARQIHFIAQTFTAETGEAPIVMCWDSEKMPSWMAYYLSREDHGPGGKGIAEAVRNTTGAHLFGENTKMFRYWHPLETFKGRPILVIAEKRWQLEWQPVLSRATPLSEVEIARMDQNGKPTGQYFYRFFKEGSNTPSSGEWTNP